MTADEAMAILRGVTYKPEFRLRFRKGRDWIVMTMEVDRPDVRDPSNVGPLVMEANVEYRLAGSRVDSILYQVRENLRRFELHECDEWIKLDGKTVWDPHKDPARDMRLEAEI